MAFNPGGPVSELLAALASPSDVEEAAEALQQRGASVVSALVDAVVDADVDPTVRERAACVLALIFPKGVACLVPWLTAADDDLADMAAWALRWPPVSGQVEPHLLDMLRSTDARMRLRGARGLKYIGVDLTAVHPVLREAARNDCDLRVRRQAQAAIARANLDSELHWDDPI